MPDLEWAKKHVPIEQVIEKLGLERYGKMVCCWRPDNHEHGDQTPSVGMDFKRNRVRCFVCDARQLSVVDLVQSVLETDTHQALLWLSANFKIPALAKGRHIMRRSTDYRVRVGVSASPFEDLVRSGLFAELGNSEQRILHVLVVFADPETCLATLSYAGLRQFSGLKKDATVSRALKRLEKLHAIEIIRGRAGIARAACNRYRVTLDDARFVTLMNECLQAAKDEREAAARLRAARKGRGITGINPLPLEGGVSDFSLPSDGSGRKIREVKF